jgi:hypothetical protein
MSDGRKSSAVDVSKALSRCQNQDRPDVLGSVWGLPVYCPGGVRHTGSMIPTEALPWNV